MVFQREHSWERKELLGYAESKPPTESGLGAARASGGGEGSGKWVRVVKTYEVPAVIQIRCGDVMSSVVTTVNSTALHM